MILTISDILPILTMVSLKICLLFSLAAVLPITQALKCIVCESVKADPADCADATKAAQDCTAEEKACLSVYKTATETMTRSCSTTDAATKAVTDAAATGSGKQ